MAKRIAALFDIDGTLIITGGAGAAAWRLAFSGRLVRADYRAISRVVYTTPVLAAVGHTEASARAAGMEPAVASAAVSDTVRSATEGSADGWLKLVADPRRGTLVGATAMGGYAEEWTSEVSLAVRAEVPVAVHTPTWSTPSRPTARSSRAHCGGSRRNCRLDAQSCSIGTGVPDAADW